MKFRLDFRVVGLLLTGVVLATLIFTRVNWIPAIQKLAANFSKQQKVNADDAHAGHDHSGHDHAGHAHADNANELPLSEQARKNLGLKLGDIKFTDYWRTVTVPGIVSEQPGHSERRITTAVNGVVTKVYAFPGQTVRPGDPLFDVQPTSELLASTQAGLLKILQEMELNEIELKRLKPLADTGTVPGTRLLEKQYERQRLDSQRLVQMQELMVRGLSADQVNEIVNSRVLIRQFTVRVPGGKTSAKPSSKQAAIRTVVVPVSFIQADAEQGAADQDLVFSVEKIDVFPGKLIQAGEELCDLALHTYLNIVGLAFQRESELIGKAILEQRPVTALFETSDGEPVTKENLKILYSDNVVDIAEGTFRFHIPLKNEITRDSKNADGVTYRSWRFKPGQRVRLLVPVEQWTERIVMPSDAVVTEGADAFVFRVNGKVMDRVPVQIEYEDMRFTVLANDGSLFPGDEVAMNQAYQLNLALKKQQGSGVDPHAGHNH
jgi:cobalt-zinc-cadmium efflux system membrane fusion protein